MCYHEQLARFEPADALLDRWLARHPDDLANLANFAEVHLTTARFDAAHSRITALLGRPKLPETTELPLRALLLVTAIAREQSTEVPALLNSLRTALAATPAGFRVPWSFRGTRYFLTQKTQHPPLVTHRAWLVELLGAVETQERDALLGTLDALAQRPPAAPTP